MAIMKERCNWCLGEFDKIDGPTHEYIESIPGCWAVYGQILSKEYEDYPHLGNIHRLTVDTYAVQHPGQPSRKSTQSVWGHLVSLYCVLERKTNGDIAREMLKKFIESKPKLGWLKPPSFEGTFTVADVVTAKTEDEHIALVRKWAESVWKAWYSIHKEEIDSVIKRFNV
jgi:hypothetical protein